MTDEVVTRLYRALAEALQQRGHSEDRPVKVSELYQQLVPYRAVRSRLGVELNADYEHALLRLLAGERGLLRLEPAQAREELRREVEAPYPFVGLFRKFSASNVWVTMPEGSAAAESSPESTGETEPQQAAAVAGEGDGAATPVAAPAPRPTGPAGPGGPGPGAHPGRREENAPHVGDGPPQRLAAEGSDRRPGDSERVTLRSGGGADPVPAVQLHAEPSRQPSREPSERLTHADVDCAFCGDDLPAGRRVRFCPHCGGDQRLRPCPRCDAVLEREWRYCISCGHEAGS